MDGEREGRPGAGNWWLVALAWLAVGIPLLWGMDNTLRKALSLFE